MTFEELYDGLRPAEREFLDRVRAVKPRKSFEFSAAPRGGAEIRFKRIEGQRMMKAGKQEEIVPQYLPENVYGAYEAMMQAMERDLGTRLLVESGYRSPAYQLYTFLFYCPKHHYSLVETGRWVALPGHSEHGAPHRQAIDFINEQGINGDDEGQTAEDFERLPEYHWLQEHAREFGFELSYPRKKKGTTFEPWHWRYVKRREITSA
jgi:D-alanyl-D-alanine carboxypeptidase